MNFLITPLTHFFEFINGLVVSVIPDISVASFIDIFIFTLIIKLLILPLTIKQTKSMVKMQQIQPKLKELQEKYKNDPQKLQQKQMEMYKENGANPLSGCLPLLIQFPIFIAMYGVINQYTGFDQARFLWVASLAQPDKTFILPILSGLTTFLTGVITQTKSNDPSAKTTKQMNIFMAIFFVYVSYKFKSGLVLYWIISNVLQLGIQYFIVNKIKREEEEKLVK